MKPLNINYIIEQQISLRDAQDMLIIHNNETFKYFDEGNTRYVFVNNDKTKVIKLAKDKFSNKFNEVEFDIYQNADEKYKKQMAPTRLENGFIEQDFCLPIKYGGRRLTIKEKLFASACRNEVGWDQEGNLVCFDLDEFLKY